MNLRFSKRTSRSSCLPPLLLFLLILTAQVSGYGSAHPALADTIIIGGKYLVVEHSLEYDTLRNNQSSEPTKPVKARPKRMWRAGFEATPGAQFNRLRSTEEGFALIDEFVGRNVRTEAAMSASAFVEYRLAKSNFWIHSGVGIDFFTVSGSGAELSTLSDSVFVYRSPETNKLQAIERFRYPIGTEFDTIDVVISGRSVAFSAIHFPLHFAYSTSLSRKLELDVFAGADVRLLNVSENDELVMLSERNSDYQLVDLSRPEAVRSLIVSPVIGSRIRLKLDKKWMLLAGVRVAHMPSAFVGDAVPFTHNAVRASLSLGWSYTFD